MSQLVNFGNWQFFDCSFDFSNRTHNAIKNASATASSRETSRIHSESGAKYKS
jgi:hypothetical protein